MSKVVSSLVRTIVDRSGTPRTEGWFTCEFGEAYQGDGAFLGGIAFDFSPYFKGLEYVNAWAVSGASLRDSVSGGLREFKSGAQVMPMPIVQDFGTPTSARFQLQGKPFGTTSGAEAMGSGYGITPLVSAAYGSISGIRFQAHILGY